MKEIFKKLVPAPLLLWYHKLLALAAAFFFRYPSDKLVLIGVTGTNGKSTTVSLIASVLEQTGMAVGATSTVFFKIGSKIKLNDKKMTMVGRFLLQKLLADMVKAGCHYAVIETSSQGIEQFRHLGLNYDVVVFTNLTPEHLEAHGGFENYKKAKGKLFAFLTAKPHKILQGEKILKCSVVNQDDEHALYFASFAADKKFGFGLNSENILPGIIPVLGRDVVVADKTGFVLDDTEIELQLHGRFNVYNALAAAAVGKALHLTNEQIKAGLEKVTGVPGRLEFINEGQPFTVIVDYAPEPDSLTKAYEVIKTLAKGKIIHVLGSCGGGRDVWRRPVLGEIAAQNADYVIVTNEDPYEEDPQSIIEAVAAGALKKQKILNLNLFKILDRREAIAKALSLAHDQDLVFITGKGSEQAMAVGHKLIKWDDREVVRGLLRQSSKIREKVIN